jgi:hypothetical protein
VVLDLAAAEIPAPRDYCHLKALAAVKGWTTLCDQLFFQPWMPLGRAHGRPFRCAFSAVAAPLHGLDCECDIGSREPDHRLIAAACKDRCEDWGTAAFI